jgi:hypothetical protein
MLLKMLKMRESSTRPLEGTRNYKSSISLSLVLLRNPRRTRRHMSTFLGAFPHARYRLRAHHDLKRNAAVPAGRRDPRARGRSLDGKRIARRYPSTGTRRRMSFASVDCPPRRALIRRAFVRDTFARGALCAVLRRTARTTRGNSHRRRLRISPAALSLSLSLSPPRHSLPASPAIPRSKSVSSGRIQAAAQRRFDPHRSPGKVDPGFTPFERARDTPGVANPVRGKPECYF